MVTWLILYTVSWGNCQFLGTPRPGLHKTGIRGIQDTRQIVDGKTNDKENNDKKGGFRFLKIRQLMKQAGAELGQAQPNWNWV